MPKILVINGHGAKLKTKISINPTHKIITPGPAESSYIVSFENMNRHLEEMTSQAKIWPIRERGTAIQWHRYHDLAIDDIGISPLQSSFDFANFAISVLSNTTKWEHLTTPPHNVMVRGALAVKRPDNSIVILEGDELNQYLTTARTGTYSGTPIFFCDKELGKVKPMGDTTLSDIYAGIALIQEFTIPGTETIVATCSPADGQNTKRISVQTYESAIDISATPFIDVFAPKVTAPQKSQPKPSSPITPPISATPSIAPATLVQFQTDLSKILEQLSEVQQKLTKKARTNSNYQEAAFAAKLLRDNLTLRKTTFYRNPTASSLNDFKIACAKDIEKAQLIFKKHRGWHQIDPLLRKFLGVLALMTLIPAVIVSLTTKHGYRGTFFETPETDTANQVASTKQQLSTLSEAFAIKLLG